MARTPIVVIGAGGFGREVAWLLEEIDAREPAWELLGFLDDAPVTTPEGYPVLGTVEGWLATGARDAHLVCAVGEPTTRARIIARCAAAGRRFATLVDPEVRRSRHVTIGEGSIVCAGNILTTNVRLGRHVIVNLDCTIGHDVTIDDFGSVMPGVHISGDVRLGRGVYVGTGAAFVQGVSVGAWTVIGAGAVVASDLPAGRIAVGVPARAERPNPRAPQDA